jgi:hypothetical protein
MGLFLGVMARQRLMPLSHVSKNTFASSPRNSYNLAEGKDPASPGTLMSLPPGLSCQDCMPGIPLRENRKESSLLHAEIPATPLQAGGVSEDIVEYEHVVLVLASVS